MTILIKLPSDGAYQEFMSQLSVDLLFFSIIYCFTSLPFNKKIYAHIVCIFSEALAKGKTFCQLETRSCDKDVTQMKVYYMGIIFSVTYFQRCISITTTVGWDLLVHGHGADNWTVGLLCKQQLCHHFDNLLETSVLRQVDCFPGRSPMKIGRTQTSKSGS